MQNIHQYIKEEIENNDVVLFMKGSKEFPQCGFSKKVADILDDMHCSYKTIDILSSNGLREGIKEYSNWPTLPQLYIKGEFIGGCDIVTEMLHSGALEELFKEKNINYTQQS